MRDKNRWVTNAIELDCAGCRATIKRGDSALAVPYLGMLCASCGWDLEATGGWPDRGETCAAEREAGQ